MKIYVVMSASPHGDTKCEGTFSTEDNARKFVRGMTVCQDVWVERHELDKGIGCAVCPVPCINPAAVNGI